ncbi:MAG: head-tail adaptor protein [Planctomycetales bacterium]|nr:head-tail adaptor protein [Planctomycetales bacterium]
MATIVTDILRPASAEAPTWAGFTVSAIDDDVVEPNLGDAVSVVADSTEQVVVMGPRAATGYSHVTRLDVKLLMGRTFSEAAMNVRVRIGAQWQPTVVVAVNDSLTWHTASFEVNTSRGALVDLAVGLAKDGTALVVIDAFYVAIAGPAELLRPENDVALFDGTEAVRLSRADGSETLVAHALRSAGTCIDVANGDSGYERCDVTWHLPVNETDASPHEGDRIVDDAAGQWTILSVQPQTLGTRFRCQARRLTIADDLRHRVTLQRAAWTKDEHGAQVPHWLDWRRNVAAHVQPIESVAVENRGRFATQTTHQVHFALPVELDHNTRIVHDGSIYRVVVVRDADRVDTLTVAEVVADDAAEG